jgi:signal peptidase II
MLVGSPMTRGRCLLLSATLLGLFGCDHGTKHLAKVHLEGSRGIELIPGVLDLKYTENTDTAFSLLGSLLGPSERYVLLTALGSLALLAFVAFIASRWSQLSSWSRFGTVLVLAGGLGNLTDRLLRGYVIDFMHLHAWPVFNVADVALCVGVPLIVLFGRSLPRAVPTPVG